jgi:uncharacterized delta-60 repeat protein
LAIDSQDRIVISGARGTQHDHDFALFRYTDGTRDRAFGAHGTVRTDFRGGDDYSSAVAIDSRGRIVATGAGGKGFALARYHADGGLDRSFSDNGKVTADVGRSAHTHGDELALHFPTPWPSTPGTGSFPPAPLASPGGLG